LKSDPDASDTSKRLAKLSSRLKKAEAENAPPARTNEGKGWSLGVEFVGGVLVGAGLGWWLDKWLGTKPWLFILLMLLGFGVGTMNAMKYGKDIDRIDDDDAK
jgi:ATP synthase protein I